MYTSSITCAIVGAIIIFFSIQNMRGDISSLHSYHRSRVKEEDIPAFGKLVGLGTLLCGIAVIIMAIFTALAIALNTETLTTVGTALMFAGLVSGIIVAFYAMKKYNGGIF